MRDVPPLGFKLKAIQMVISSVQSSKPATQSFFLILSYLFKLFCSQTSRQPVTQPAAAINLAETIITIKALGERRLRPAAHLSLDLPRF